MGTYTRTRSDRDAKLNMHIAGIDDDLQNYGITIGCPGCGAKNRRESVANHSEESRQRKEEKLRVDHPEEIHEDAGKTCIEYIERGYIERRERR